MIENYRQAHVEFQRAYWRNALRETQGNVSAAARKAGVNRTDLYNRLKRLNVCPPRRAKRGNWHGL